jgi:hypothetical protein
MWNAQRTQALYRTFYQMLYPLFAKELEEKLLQEAKDFVIKVSCCIFRNQWKMVCVILHAME